MIPSIVSAQNIFPVAGNVGIGSNLPPAVIPIKPLHIFNPPNWTDDPAIRLESGFIVGGQVGTLNNGHLALLTNTNLAFYTRCIQYSGYGISSASIGDMVLQTSDRGEDLILTTRNANGHIRFATTPTDTDGPGGIIDDDYERMTITPSGKIGIQCPNPLGALDVNLGTADWQYNLPKVSMIQGNNGYPQIRLYSPTGNTWNDRAQSTSWYIEQSNTYDYQPLIPGTYSALRFRAGINPSGGTVPYLNDIGSEVPITRMSLISNGNVGINQDKPIAKFQVTNGSILFDGEVGSTPKKIDGSELREGTRMMWIPEKAAFRAGRLENYLLSTPGAVDYWNSSNIGLYSFAFGFNCQASAESSIAMGYDSWAAGANSVAIGQASRALGEGCVAIGTGTGNPSSTASGTFAVAIGGSNTQATGNSSTAMGSNAVASGSSSSAFGNQVSATGINSTAVGNTCFVTAHYSGVYGQTANVEGYTNNFAFGNYIKSKASPLSGSSGAFTIGSGNLATGGTLINDMNNTLMIGCQSPYPSIILTGGNLTQVAKVGIDTKSPCALFSVKGNAIVGSTWAGDGSKAPVSGCSLVVEDKVGIGTASPNNALSVVGSGSTITVANDNTFAVSDPNIDLAIEKKAVIGGNTVLHSNDNYVLHVDGDAYKLGSGGPVWNITSDVRYKKNISSFTDGLSLLKQIKPIWFDYNGKMGISSSHPQVGVVAQEIQKILPYTISSDTISRTLLVKEEKRYEVDAIDTIVIQAIDTSVKDSIGQYKIKDSIIFSPVKKWVVEPAEFVLEKAEALTYNANALWYLIINSIKELDSSFIAITEQYKKRLDSIEKESNLNHNTNDSLQTIVSSLQERISRLEAQNNIPLNDAMDVILEQNNPNPFAESTTITYYVPETVNGTPELIITSSTNSQIKATFQLTKGMPTQLLVSAQNFNTGVYVYSIIVQNKILASKKFIIIK